MTIFVELLKKSYPSYINEQNYGEFYKFLNYYYEWLDSNDNIIDVINKYLLRRDITSSYYNNNTDEDYLNSLLYENGFEYNFNFTISKSFLLQFLKDFYVSAGTINSLQFLFKILFNKNVIVFYPREQMIILSGNDYVSKKYIITSANILNTIKDDKNDYILFNDFISNENKSFGLIQSVTTNKIASIESFHIINIGQKVYFKIYLSESTINDYVPYDVLSIRIDDTFYFNESIVDSIHYIIDESGYGYNIGDKLIVSDCGINGVVEVDKLTKGQIDSIDIENAGINYDIGDIIIAYGSTTGHSFKAYVKSVDVQNGITSINIICNGYEYNQIPELKVISRYGTGALLNGSSTSINGIKSLKIVEPYLDTLKGVNPTCSFSNNNTASISAFKLSYTKEQPKYSNHKNIIGLGGVITDSYYYSQYSYVIESDIDRKYYKSYVDKYIHPVGYLLFSKFIHEEVGEILLDDDVFTISKIKAQYSTDSSHIFDEENDIYFYIDKNVENIKRTILINSIMSLDFYKISDNFTGKVDYLTLQNIFNEETYYDKVLDAEIDLNSI